MPATDLNPFEPPPIPQVDWGGWLGVPWYEEQGPVSPSKGSTGLTSTTETLVIIVNWADELTAESNLVGYHEVGSTTIGGTSYPIINRHIPKTHPLKEWLYATRVEKERLAPVLGFVSTALAADAPAGSSTVQVDSNLNFVANRAVILGYGSDSPEAHTIEKLAGADSIVFNEPTLNIHLLDEVLRSSNSMQPILQYHGSSTAPVGAFFTVPYTLSRLTITFNSLPFTVLDDADLQALTPGVVPNETLRYCQIFGVEGGDFLARAKGSFQWAEGTGVGGQPLKGSEVDASIGQRLIKPTLTIVWNAVPPQFILDANFVPKHFQTCEGCVNADTFFGRLPGTLLCLPIKYDPEEQPVNPIVLGLNAGAPPRQYKVTVSFAEFNPAKGNATSTFRGWLTAPNPGDNKWYGIIGNDSVTQQYSSATMATIFQGL